MKWNNFVMIYSSSEMWINMGCFVFAVIQHFNIWNKNDFNISAIHLINFAVLRCCVKQFSLWQEVLSSLNSYRASQLLWSIIIAL